MSDLKDNQMSRGLNQALYRYLPERWIDFYMKNRRINLSAKVRSWNSVNLTGINENRLLSAISQAVNSFAVTGDAKGFGEVINDKTYSVLTPKYGDDRAIIAEVNPLTFFCSNPNCKKVYSFSDSHTFLSNPKNRYCKECNHELKQIRLIYFCECGWAQPVKSIPCSNRAHGFKHLKRGNKFDFVCGACGQHMQMIKKCDDCGKKLYPKNVLDSSQYYPFSLCMIDCLC